MSIKRKSIVLLVGVGVAISAILATLAVVNLVNSTSAEAAPEARTEMLKFDIPEDMTPSPAAARGIGRASETLKFDMPEDMTPSPAAARSTRRVSEMLYYRTDIPLEEARNPFRK